MDQAAHEDVVQVCKPGELNGAQVMENQSQQGSTGLLKICSRSILWTTSFEDTSTVTNCHEVLGGIWESPGTIA